MKKIGILYSTVDGQTRKICEALRNDLQNDHEISLFPVSEFEQDILSFDILILGASIRYGKHHPTIYEFIDKNRGKLEKVHAGFFSVNLVARKAGKDRASTNPYLIKFLDTINWKPDLVDVFAGCLDYKRYRFWDRIMIKTIMKFTGGPTTTTEPIEYTDWNRVKLFAEKIRELAFAKPEDAMAE